MDIYGYVLCIEKYGYQVTLYGKNECYTIFCIGNTRVSW